MKLLFVTSHRFLPARVGGAESSTHDLASALQSAGHEVAVLARGESTENSVTSTYDLVMGYPVWRLQAPLEHIAPVAVHFGADWIVGGHELAAHTEVLNGLDGSTCIYLRDVEFGPAAWRMSQLHRCAMVANSSFVAQRAALLFSVQPTIIFPLVMKERYRVAREGQNVVFINPIPKKGLEVALQVARQRPDLAFDFIEAWPLSAEQRSYYQVKAASSKNVQCHPPILDMRVVYARARLVLVPSIWEEAWGRVVTEAQLSGIPVVASGRGGLPQAVGGGGVVVDSPGDLPSWLQAVDTLSHRAGYERFSAAAVASSQRPELDAQTILQQFTGVLQDSPQRAASPQPA